MTSIDLQTQKELLESLKQNIATELKTMAIYHPDTDDWEARFDFDDHDEADDDLISDSAEAAEEQIATLSLLETRYRNIVRALQRIEDGTYGLCEISGEPIEDERLRANPAARTCKAHLDAELDLPL